MMKNVPSRKQRGVALIVAMLLLVVTSVLALSAVRFSVLSLRVATNTEYRLLGAYENVQSVIDATLADSTNTPVTAATGYIACTSTSLSNCSGLPVVTLPGSFLSTDVAAGQVQVKVKSLGAANPPRRTGYELDSFSAAQLSIEATYDHNTAGDGRGKSQVNEGVILVYPKT
jgi:hypothetical protein